MDDPGPSNAYYRRFPETADGPLHQISPPSSPLLSAQNGSAIHGDEVDNDAFYTILNVPKTASESEIRESYRSLAFTFHPDRQRDDHGRLAAHGRFQAIQRAYEVLTDPTKRTIYDMFGEEGLKTNWEVGHRIKSPEEMRRHFQRQAYTKRQLEVDALVKSRSDLTMYLDARVAFLPKSFFAHPDRERHDVISRTGRIRPGRISMRHSFEVPVNDRTQVVCAGQVVTRSGQGGANVIGTVKHQFSPKLWMEVGTSFLSPRALTGKATYTFDQDTYLTINTVQQTLLAPPRISLSLGRRIYAQTTGFITFRSGFYSLGPWGSSLPHEVAMSDRSALSVGLTTANRDGTGWTVESQAGIIDSHLSADYSLRVLGLKLKFGGATGSTDGYSAFVDAESKVTSNTRIGYNLQADTNMGLIMRVRFSRLGQKVAIPFILAPKINPPLLAAFTLIPAASYAVLHHFYLLPRKRRRIKERIIELREEHAEFIAQKKAEAQQAVMILERPTAAKAAQERQGHGLIIISAHYGLARGFTDRGMKEHEGEGESVIDVTIPIQALVSGSRLFIPGGRAKHNILGFWDPCIGENKKLRIRYLFRDRLHQVTVDDVGAIRAPLKAHALDANGI